MDSNILTSVFVLSDAIAYLRLIHQQHTHLMTLYHVQILIMGTLR